MLCWAYIGPSGIAVAMEGLGILVEFQKLGFGGIGCGSGGGLRLEGRWNFLMTFSWLLGGPEGLRRIASCHYILCANTEMSMASWDGLAS